MDYFSLTSRLILPLTVSSLFLLAWSISLISCSSWAMDIEYLNNISLLIIDSISPHPTRPRSSPQGAEGCS